MPHHRCLRRSHCGFEQCFVANAMRAAVRRQDLRVNRFNGGNRKMAKCFAHDNRLKSTEFFLINRLAAAVASLDWIDGRIGVKTIEPPSCTVTVT